MGAGTPQEERFFDAGVLIGALLSQDLRHAEALPLVEAARRGDWAGCTSTGILAEVYVHLTNERASPPHTPAEAQAALLRLIEPPSALRIVAENGFETAWHMLSLAEANGLRSKNVHDARHAASALGGVQPRCSRMIQKTGSNLKRQDSASGGPASTLRRLGR